MTATTQRALWATVETVVEASTQLTHSDTVLDPRDRPQTHLDRLFSIDLQSTNSGQYRDQSSPGARLLVDLILRCAWRLNPKNHAATWQRALDDEEAAIAALCTSTTSPLNVCSVSYVRSARTVSTSREWLFADVGFRVGMDLAYA